MVFKITGGIFLILYGISALGLSVPEVIIAIFALIAGIALIAGV